MSQGSKTNSRRHVHVRCDYRVMPRKKAEGQRGWSNRKKALRLWHLGANMRIGGERRNPGREGASIPSLLP